MKKFRSYFLYFSVNIGENLKNIGGKNNFCEKRKETVSRTYFYLQHKIFFYAIIKVTKIEYFNFCLIMELKSGMDVINSHLFGIFSVGLGGLFYLIFYIPWREIHWKFLQRVRNDFDCKTKQRD